MRKLFKKPLFLIITTAVVIVAFFSYLLIYKIILKPDVKKGLVADEVEWRNYDDIMRKIKEGELNNPVFDESETEEVIEDSDAVKEETLITSFFYYINRNELDFLLSLLTGDRLERDFFIIDDLQQREETFRKAMQEISRNGKIDKVSIVRASRLIGGLTRIVVDIYYIDLDEPVRVNLEVAYIEQMPYEEVHEEGFLMPLIQSSILKMAKQVKEKTS